MRNAGFATASILLAGCASLPTGAPAGCDNADGALDDAAFVIATAPPAGARVSSGFGVSGCSRTFESTVVWRLHARDGSLLGQGTATGGGVDGFGPFAFAVPFSVAERQVGTLEVFEEDASGGEGFPPGRTVLPLVLLP
jgi:Immunoglobulin-like domain of bacterial spore germination